MRICEFVIAIFFICIFVIFILVENENSDIFESTKNTNTLTHVSFLQMFIIIIILYNKVK